jgi:hypothetical protein
MMETIYKISISRYFNPVIENNTVFLIDRNDNLVSYDLENKINRSLSKINIPGDQPLWNISSSKEYLLIPMREKILVVKKNTGKILLEYSFNDDRLVFASINEKGNLIAVFPNGVVKCISFEKRILWEQNLGVPVYRWDLAEDNNVVYIGIKNALYALNSENGNVFWSFKTESPLMLRSRIAVSNERLFFVDGKKFVSVKLNGEEDFKTVITETSEEVLQRVALIRDGNAYIWSEKKIKTRRSFSLTCFDLSNQKIVWREKFDRYRDEDYPFLSAGCKCIAVSVGSRISIIEHCSGKKLYDTALAQIISHKFIDEKILCVVTNEEIVNINVPVIETSLLRSAAPDMKEGSEKPFAKGLLSRLFQHESKMGDKVSESIEEIKETVKSMISKKTLSDSLPDNLLNKIKSFVQDGEFKDKEKD